MLLPTTLLLATCGWTLPYRATPASRAPPVRCDADRCYYGDLDASGNVVKREAKRSGPALTPTPSLTPREVVDAQFESLSIGTYAGIEEAYAFVAPSMVEKYQIDLPKFKAVLSGDAFDGLVGCAEWTVQGISQPADDVAVVTLKVLPKPIAGCVRTSGVASQDGITWPTFYKWHLGRVPAEAAEHAGCWMLDNMQPIAPPIDVEAEDSVAPSLAAASAAAAHDGH